MQVRTLLSAAVILSAAMAVLPQASAGVFGGNVTKVADSNDGITVVSLSGKVTKIFAVPRSARITLDGKPAQFADLKPGVRVSVFTNSTGTVTRVKARTKSAAPTPRKNRKKLLPAKSLEASTEWHQFRGPNRDNVSSETGLLKTWPADGPKLLWKATGVGEGYSTVSLSHGMVYTMGNRGGDEMIIALDLMTGKEKWAASNGDAFRQGRGNGPRGTPTIDGDLVFGLGGSGNLSCMNAKDGSVKWQKNILKEFGGRNISWGISESVLIDGDKLICTPGGRGATVVALNKNTGKAIWQSAVEGNPRAGYASPIVAVVGGVRQYVVFTSRGVVGVRASDGKAMWSNSSSSNGTANCSTPLLHENSVFTSSNYGKGAALLRLQSRGNTTTARQVYHTRDMKNHHGGMVIVDGYLYGSNSGILTCLDVKTGNVKWRQRGAGKGSLTYADGHIYFRSEGGPMILIEATPTGYKEKARFRQPNRSRRPSWSHPVVANGKLFLRDMDVLLCYDLKSK